MAESKILNAEGTEKGENTEEIALRLTLLAHGHTISGKLDEGSPAAGGTQ
jgi:hypothetical protein